MNSKEMKRINRHCETLMVEWLKSIVPEEEAEKITIDNYKGMLPNQTHFYGDGKFLISSYSPKWFKKRVKKLSAANRIEDITLQQVKDA
jgi:hypothetical protein